MASKDKSKNFYEKSQSHKTISCNIKTINSLSFDSPKTGSDKSVMIIRYQLSKSRIKSGRV